MIKHYRTVKKSNDYKIALGILDGLNYNTQITKYGTYNYSFSLDGFNIRLEGGLYVDNVKLELTNDDYSIPGIFPDPGYNMILKIKEKLEDITTKEQRDAEELIKKDAFISLYKRNN
jgi:hypothetical protein